MGQTGQLDLDEGLSPAELLEQLKLWQRRQRSETRTRTSFTFLFFVGMCVALWVSFDHPAKASESIAAAIAFALLGLLQGIFAFSSHAQDRRLRTCRNALEAKVK